MTQTCSPLKYKQKDGLGEGKGVTSASDMSLFGEHLIHDLALPSAHSY